MSRAALLAVAACATPLCLAGAPGPRQGWAAADLRVDEWAGDLGPITDFAFLPDGRAVIVEKSGAVKLRAASGAVTTAGKLAVDEESEKGLLGVAVDPQFARTARLFLYYSLPDGQGGTDVDRHRVVSMRLRADGTLDRASEKVLVRGLRGPANHDGGGLAIARDGKLYIGVGDTGCNSGLPPGHYEPTNHFGGCLSNANGKILRVELDGAIPADNPLVGVGAVPACGDRCGDPMGEGSAPPRRDIWAWGFRNPFRLWVDPRTGRVWVGDVGEVTYEEIVVAQAGRHHGWPWREGTSGWPPARCRAANPGGQDCVDPVYFCRHGAAGGGVDGGCQSITGGVIVDACHWPPAERDRYVFADNATGWVWSIAVDARRAGVLAGTRRELTRVTSGIPVAVHLGPDGDVYVASYPGDAGRILRISPAHPVACTR